MYKFLVVIACFAISSSLIADQRDFSAVKSWKKNSNGKMTIRKDEKENAIRVDTDFSETKGNDYWTYPVLKVGKVPADSKYLIFDFKASQDEQYKTFKYSAVMFAPGKAMNWGRFRPTSNWSTVVIDLKKCSKKDLAADLATVKTIRIGVNPKGKKVNMWFKNVRFTAEAPNL